MKSIEAAKQFLAAQPLAGYYAEQAPASEPTALAALALLSHHELGAATRALEWLGSLQQADGSVGVREREPAPIWPTSLAALAWTFAAQLDHSSACANYKDRAARAVQAILGVEGLTYPRDNLVQHDTTIVAWPWVTGTHAWIEPTAFHLIALKAAKKGNHPRAQDAVRMLFDRQLPAGGCNYGNRIVLGQELRPHVQGTGIALLALHSTPDPDGCIERAISWLHQVLDERTTALSLAWALLGLASHDRVFPFTTEFLDAAWRRESQRKPSPYKAALLLLAAQGSEAPLVTLQLSEQTQDVADTHA